MKILINPNPLLRIKSAQMDIKEGPCPLDIVDKLKEFCKLMYKADGAGLAAPQVGWHIRLFAIVLKPEDLIIINPIINKFSVETKNGVEGCLSVPGKAGNVIRHTKINVSCLSISIKSILREKQIKVEPRNIELSNKEAICFQHELGHLEGQLYIDIANKIWDVT